MLKKLIRENRGQAVVEMVLVLPLFILLLFGIFEGGILLGSYVELQHSARDAARYMAIHTDVNSTADLRDWVDPHLAILKPEKLIVTWDRDMTVQGGKVIDSWATVNMQYPVNIITPILSDIWGSTVNLSTSMSMRVE